PPRSPRACWNRWTSTGCHPGAEGLAGGPADGPGRFVSVEAARALRVVALSRTSFRRLEVIPGRLPLPGTLTHLFSQPPDGPVQPAGTVPRRTRCGWSPTGTETVFSPVAKSMAVTRSAPLSDTTQDCPSPLTVAQYGLDTGTRGPSRRVARSTTVA